MKKFLFPIVLMTALLAVSCSKSFDASEEGLTGSSKVFTAVIQNDGDDTKTTLTSDKKVNWVQDDEISINGVKYLATPKEDKTTAKFEKSDTKDDPSGTYYAYYPYSIYDGTTATLPATQTYNSEAPFSNNPMYATSSSTSLAFKNICGILAINVTSDDIATVKTITVSSSNLAMSGAFTITDNAAVLSSPSDVSQKVTLNCGDEGVAMTSSATTFYVAIPAQTYQDLLIVLSDGTTKKAMVTKANTDIPVDRNKIYSIDFSQNTSYLTGEFSVSDTKTVKFTPGNLYWDGSAYHFESTQYAYPTSWSTSHVGHFFWTNLTDYQSGTATYMPYAESYSYSSQSENDKFFCGEENPLEVDGVSDCYVLSSSEWSHLINSRTNASSLCAYGVTVCNKSNCIVIAPDDYDYTTSPLQSSYDVETWATAEAAGLVCIPNAGYRSDSGVWYGGTFGYYWSSTPYGESAAYALYFYSGGGFDLSYNRQLAQIVRLVRE